MAKVRLLEEAMSMLGVIDGASAVQNLRNQVSAVIEHLIQESTGEVNCGWLNKSLRLLKPRCGEDNFLYEEEMLRTYTQIMNVYDHIRKNGKYETDNMKKFRGSINFYIRSLELIGHCTGQDGAAE